VTNLQLYLAIGFPMILVLISYSATIFQISGFRDEVKNQLSGVKEDVRNLREDLREMRGDMREIRSDIKMLTGKVYELMGEK
jgi:archaellum component FlaC